MGAFLLAGGTKGKRFCLPNSEVMIHQPLGGAQGQASDIEITANHIIKTKKKMIEMLAKNTGQDIEKVATDVDRDYFMTSDEAVKYGLVDKVIKRTK
jgi:ATP-dependent Clp protease protease subunit